MSATSISPPDPTMTDGRSGLLHPRAIRTLVARDWLIMRSYRTALITDLMFGFLNLILYHYISKTLRPRPGHGLGGAPSYFAFAVVGLALTLVLQAAVVGLSRRLREEQLTGTLEAVMVQPISATDLALGLAGFPFLFACVRAIVYLVLAGAFLGLSFAHCDWLGLVASFAAAGISYAALGIGLGALVLVFKRAEAAGAVAVVSLGLIGGALFPIAVLPGWLRALSYLIPTRYAYESVRNALFGTGSWATSAGILLVMGAVMMASALVLFRGALRLVIRRGTISQY